MESTELLSYNQTNTSIKVVALLKLCNAIKPKLKFEQ